MHSGAAASYRLETIWATSTEEVREAQRLRFRVFASEMGARLQVPPGAPADHDIDRFDDFCAHVLVRAVPAGEALPRVIGTYRVLTPQAARNAGGYYSETEFDMERLAPLRLRMAELGRSCIDPGWRTGGAILALWSALGDFLTRHGLDIAFGCASVSLADGGQCAAGLWHRLSVAHLGPAERRVRPWHPLPLDRLRGDPPVSTPPLIKGYLRCGAELLGAPAWDANFNTADLPMLLTLAGLPQRHHRRFIAPALRREPA
ncbi:MAG: GNAT family N-acyltransferase [Variovorax sp.]